MERLLNKKEQRRQFSRVGLSLFVLFVLILVLQSIAIPLMERLVPDYTQNIWLYFLATSLPWYLLAAPYCFLLLRLRTYGTPPRQGLKPLEFISFFPICITAMYVGNWVAGIINTLLSALLGREPQYALQTLLSDAPFWPTLIFVVILGPLVEELIFRKGIIDALYPFGERVSILVSALLFAAFHGNFYQFFYAFLMGCILGLVYCRSGKLRYPVLLHCAFNFVGSIVSRWVTSSVDLNALSQGNLLELLGENPIGVLIALVYSGIMFGLMTLGVALLFIKRKQFKLLNGTVSLHSPALTPWLNVGMILFILSCLYLFVQGL